jgi:hypothetical protein
MAERHPIGLLSLLVWVLASAVGWFLSPFLAHGVALPLLTDLFRRQEVPLALEMAVYGIILGILIGVTFGVLQWLILRRHITRAYWWIAATTGGLGLGMALGLLLLSQAYSGQTWVSGPIVTGLYLLLNSIVAGVVVGLLQRLVLRRHFNGTWLWMLSSALTWPMYLLYHGESVEVATMVHEAISMLYWGLALGALSGVTIILISTRRREAIQINK